MVTMLDEKTVKARKVHRCQMCGRDIEKGQSHYTQRNADGYSIWTYRAHTECNHAYPAYLKWCGIEGHWMDDGYGSTDEDEFREFLATHKARHAD